MSIQQAIEVLKTEANGILELTEKIDAAFTEMVDLICSSQGRVIISGIGKSGLIGRKIVATLNSTGTRAIFLHPVEAMHGDLGIVSRQDVFIALSNSGETDELNILLPSIRNAGCPAIAFTGNKQSTLAGLCDIVIDVGIKTEACPLGLAPTTSTTALLAMGDALAVVLIDRHHFSPTDFKKFHPGGNLGQRLASFKVKDIMLTGTAIPMVTEDTDMNTALEILDKKNLGVVIITQSDHTISGIITDGDIRRMLIKKIPFLGKTAKTLMTQNPKSANEDIPLYDALDIMEKHQITVLPVIDANQKISGVLHLHDILGKGSLKFNSM